MLSFLPVFLFIVAVARGNDVADEFMPKLAEFLNEKGYNGGSVGIMRNGALQMAHAYGLDGPEGNALDSKTIFPLSRLTQTFTAVSVYQLIQDKLFKLDSKVFGVGGLLEGMQPFKYPIEDPRIYDITVDHLLRHTAGWDQSKGPLYDPLMNKYYINEKMNVTNISHEMEISEDPSCTDIIRFAIGHQLHYAPGSQQVISNLGYAVLGKIIEEKSGMFYTDYVKRNILEVCGLWSTRMGPHKWTNSENETNNVHTVSRQIRFPYSPVAAEVLDSSLGWYSNVYDVMRFMRCLEEGDILRPETVLKMMKRSSTVPLQHTHSWIGAGFRVGSQGNVWLNGDELGIDLVVYHQGLCDKTRANKLSWVFLFDRGSNAHLKHQTKSLVEGIREWSDFDRFWTDLTDFFVDSSTDTVIKLRLDEHHLKSYTNALRLQNFKVVWISAFHDKHTYFTVVAEKDDKMADYVVEVGLTENQLLKYKLYNDKNGYNLTFLQNYRSFSHMDTDCFLAVFTKHGMNAETNIKYGTQHFARPYDELLKLYNEEGFHPIVQNIFNAGEEDLVSFIFVQDKSVKRKIQYKSYHDLTGKKLVKMIKKNGAKDRTLSYIDATISSGKPKFSAIFAERPTEKWHFEMNLSKEQAIAVIQKEMERGLVPNILVGYVTKNDGVKYLVHLMR